MSTNGQTNINYFNKKLFQEIFDKKDLNKEDILSIDILVESLQKQDINELAQILKRVALNRNYTKFTKDEFLAFCYWQTKINHLITLCGPQKIGTLSPEEIMKKLRHLGFEITQEEIENHVGNINKCCHRQSNVGCEFCIRRYDNKPFKDMVSEFHRVMVDTGDDTIIPVKEDDPNVFMSKNTAKQLISGGIAGIVSRTVTAPIDRVKVLMQIEAFSKEKLKFIDVIKKIYMDGGYAGFWRGNGINCIKVGSEYALRFAFYDFFKKIRLKDKNSSTLFDKFICGSLAGTASQLIVYPTEVIKTRMAVSNLNQYTGILDAVYKIGTREGYASFYRGIIPCLVGAFPYNGINLSVYESIKYAYKNYYIPHTSDISSNIEAIFLASSLAACVAQFSTYPLVVIRTNMQVYQRPGKLNIPNDIRYMSKLCVDIYKTNGIRGFYRGIWPNFIKVLPSVALSFIIYEKTLSFLKD